MSAMDKYSHLPEVVELKRCVGESEFLKMIVAELTDSLAWLMEASKSAGVGAGTFCDLVDKVAAAVRAMQAEEENINE